MPIRHEKIKHNLTVRKSAGPGMGIDHWHQRAELVYVMDGACQIRISKQQRLCGPGDLAVIRSGEIHSLLSNYYSTYIYTFDPAMFSQFLPEFRFPKSFISAEEQKEAGLDREIARLFDEIYREKVAEEPLCEPIMRADVLRLYSLLIRHFEDSTPRDEKSLARLQQFQTALEYIAEHYAQPITLADVAEVINYTPSYVSTLFVSCAGVNFKTYLDNFRIKKAADLLCSTHLTVTDIALQCGFENVRTFNNVFRRITGQSPSQLRKTNV